MHRKLCLISLFAFALSVACPSFASDSTFETRLQDADRARSSDPQKFQELLAQLRLDKQNASPKQLQRLRYLEAYELGVYGDKLAEGVKMARSLYDTTRDPAMKYRAGSLVANLSAINRDFTTGLRYLEKTLATRHRIKDKAIRHDGLGAAALLYNEIGQHRIGIRYADEMLADSPGPRSKCGAGYVRADSMQELGSLKDDAEAQRVIDACLAARERIFANASRAVLAKKWSSEGRLKDAVSLMESALPEIESTRYPRLIARAHALLADIKFKMGDLKGAEKHANATVALGEQIRSSAPLVSAYNTLYLLAAEREKPSVALDLYRRYAEAQMAHQDDVKSRELAYEIVRHENMQQSQQIALLERNNQVLRLQQTLERESAQKARLAMVFLMLVLAAMVFWALQIKRHQRQLKRLAQTDTLTGLGNRHYFTKKSERALIDAARAGEPAALVMFDLDHFKAINDTYGHGAGDWVLKQVGKTCASHCRKIDYIGRIGGEEFAVLMRGYDLEAATRLAENCRAQLAQIDTRESGYSFVVTASFGVSSTALSGYDLSRLLSHADKMLYRAKNEGRNRVCAYTEETAADAKAQKRSPSLSVVNS